MGQSQRKNFSHEMAPGESSQEMLRRSRSNELFIAIVGPAGSGVGTCALALKGLLETEVIGGHSFEVEIVKGSEVIREWATREGLLLPPPAQGGQKTIEAMEQMQDRGDDMRRLTRDNAAITRGVIRKIMEARARATGSVFADGAPVAPDSKPRAYIIDSLRHSAEAHLLRRVYQDAFALVGVVCDPEQRRNRLTENYFGFNSRALQSTKDKIERFMDRDANSSESYGQHVTDTFQEADYFVDNSEKAPPNQTKMNESLHRFVHIMTMRQVVRPTIAETAMHHAHSARLRSACMSRQVGAALVDQRGNIVATGTNEVPRAGGGVYGESFDRQEHLIDHRCVFRASKYCSSNKEQNQIIEEMITAFPELVSERGRDDVVAAIRRTRIGGLIEFSRAVHAEMDAILSAARVGVSPVGCRLFVTTFPCHYCARHIVAAGIDEVQYIEPYPKSRAVHLHDDSISTGEHGWVAPSLTRARQGAEVAHTGNEQARLEQSRVLFRPFTGVAPRMYARAFLKDRDYKNKVSGDLEMGVPDWGGPWDLLQVPYTKLEAELSKANA
jgi:deoxycytidylate deaminase